MTPMACREMDRTTDSLHRCAHRDLRHNSLHICLCGHTWPDTPADHRDQRKVSL